jgi:transcriptional regulator with XRE-family HTH domain
LSADAFASLVDLEVQELAEMERGAREPNLALLCKLAEALDVKPSDLILRTERKLQ